LLQQGEIVTLNQRIDGGLSTFTAGANGTVVVPAVLAVRSFDEGAVLSRANRGNLANVRVTAVHFQRLAVLHTPGARSHQLQGDSQRAFIVSTYHDRIETIEIDALGIPRALGERVDRGKAGAEMRTAMAAHDETTHPWHADIPGLVRVHSVPGHESASIAVAELDDRTFRSLAKELDGSVRVTGMLAHWAKSPPISGPWAISSESGDRIGIFAVTRKHSS
jgi:hypothetical protein